MEMQKTKSSQNNNEKEQSLEDLQYYFIILTQSYKNQDRVEWCNDRHIEQWKNGEFGDPYLYDHLNSVGWVQVVLEQKWTAIFTSHGTVNPK